MTLPTPLKPPAKLLAMSAAAQVLEEVPPTPKSKSPAKIGRPSKPGPASKRDAPGPASKQNNELKNLLGAEAIKNLAPESRKNRSDPVRDARSRRSESSSIGALKSDTDIGPRNRRSLPTPVEKPEPVSTRTGPRSGPASKKNSKQDPVEPAPARATRGGQPTTPKSDTKLGKLKKSANRGSSFEPQVVIRKVERQRAEREFERYGVQRSKLSVQTPKAGTKRGAPKKSEQETPQPPKKRSRQSIVPESPEPVTPKPVEVSSFGRRRTPKSDKAFISTDIALANHEQEEEEDRPIRKRKTTAVASKTPTKKTPKEREPAKAEKSTIPKPTPRSRKSATREELVFVEPVPAVRIFD